MLYIYTTSQRQTYITSTHLQQALHYHLSTLISLPSNHSNTLLLVPWSPANTQSIQQFNNSLNQCPTMLDFKLVPRCFQPPNFTPYATSPACLIRRMVGILSSGRWRWLSLKRWRRRRRSLAPTWIMVWSELWLTTYWRTLLSAITRCLPLVWILTWGGAVLEGSLMVGCLGMLALGTVVAVGRRGRGRRRAGVRWVMGMPRVLCFELCASC